MKIKIISILSVFCFFGCKTRNNITIQNNPIEAIKFMGSITTQPYSINEKTFWNSKDEHAKLLIKNNVFIEDVKNLKNHSSQNFKEYNYAFIMRHGKSTDTLYSDSSLQSWILKENNTTSYFYDEEGIIAEKLRASYSFFYDCW
ncbi:hypothetical protein [Flavobacterium sp. 28YEA47A]|uniref:hypothetical protein n=1 Tax=Flavobacterium sp. 28YEA47A TaxID=3156276 RepID=UPI0035151013